MKKLFILVFIIFLFSCEKEGPDCWTCKITTAVIWEHGEKTTEFTIMKCDIPTEDIILFEKENTYTTSKERDMGVWGDCTIITTKTTKCFK